MILSVIFELVTLGVTFLHLYDVCDNTAVLAIRKHINQRASRLRIAAPTIGTRILSSRIKHIAGFRIEHFRQLFTLAAAELVRERRTIPGS
jgi:hypothetical protein